MLKVSARHRHASRYSRRSLPRALDPSAQAVSECADKFCAGALDRERYPGVQFAVVYWPRMREGFSRPVHREVRRGCSGPPRLDTAPQPGGANGPETDFAYICDPAAANGTLRPSESKDSAQTRGARRQHTLLVTMVLTARVGGEERRGRRFHNSVGPLSGRCNKVCVQRPCLNLRRVWPSHPPGPIPV